MKNTRTPRSFQRHPLLVTALSVVVGIAISTITILIHHLYVEMPDSLMSGYD
ncbi:MAG: hypothetical protein HGB29_06835 [Chlorobiaceae bacterium]|nr:hypothetical protein [Chlorobiaceae bacterium]NTW74563.1 hypothetical protein [Chlorobiaceae bacterium]